MIADNLKAETMHMFTITDGLVNKYPGSDDTLAIADSGNIR